MFNNRYQQKHFQHGQSTIEFIIACLVMIPLFFGIYYLVRYSDIKQSAIQASRYAAFERTWDPNQTIKSDSVLQEEVRARFFLKAVDEKKSIGYHDKSSASNFGNIPLFVQADSKKLINAPSDVQLSWDNSYKLTAGSWLDNILFSPAASLFKLPKGGIVKAQVDVPLVNIAHFEPLKAINIKLPAATAIGGGSWNASGTKGGADTTCARVSPAVPTSNFGGLASGLTSVLSVFEKSEFKLGIILPDYVPPGSVRTNNSASPSSTPLEQQNPSGTAGDKGTEC